MGRQLLSVAALGAMLWAPALHAQAPVSSQPWVRATLTTAAGKTSFRMGERVDLVLCIRGAATERQLAALLERYCMRAKLRGMPVADSATGSCGLKQSGATRR